MFIINLGVNFDNSLLQNNLILSLNDIDNIVLDNVFCSFYTTPVAAYVTNSGKDITFFLPYMLTTEDSFSCLNLSVTLRHSNGGYAYARSGSEGENYTQLGSSLIQIWNNEMSYRMNEVDDIIINGRLNSGFFMNIKFIYPIYTSNNSNSIITNNTPIALNVSGSIIIS